MNKKVCESTEKQYLDLVKRIIETGEVKDTRNGKTTSVFGAQIRITELKDGKFPLLTSRKHFSKGIIGEYATFLKGPKSVKDFEDEGCNYWKLWADNEAGDLRVDYGNAWLDFTGDGTINQVDYCINLLKTDPNSRRIIINAWNPEHVINKKLSLECCHYGYQFHVSEGKYLNILVQQRSVDTLIGMPSDFILFSMMVITFAKASGLEPGEVIISFGDTHIYNEHLEDAKKQIENETFAFPTFTTDGMTDDIYTFSNKHIQIHDYKHSDPIKYLLKA